MHSVETVGVVLGVIVAALAVLGAAVAGGRTVLRLYRGLTNLVEDWRGEPARPGVAGRPGVMARLERIELRQQRIEAQLLPNGGASLRDAVNRIEQAQP